MVPLAKNITRYFSKKQIIVILISLVTSVGLGFGAVNHMKKTVVINYNGNMIEVSTNKSTIREVLNQNSISVTSSDYISLPIDHKLQTKKDNYIFVKSAVPVSILFGNSELNVATYKDKVSDVVKDNIHSLYTSYKLIGANNNDKVVSNMKFRVVTTAETIISSKDSLPYKATYKENPNLPKGTRNVIKEGGKGICEQTYKVLLEDGKEIARHLIKSIIICNPSDSIIEIGTASTQKTSRGDSFRYSKILDMRATAYTASYKDTGKHPGQPGFGITRTGVRAKKGIIAVDPRVIPLGTKVYIQCLNGIADYGYAIAADTGGAIKGDLIDLYVDDQYSAQVWGCKKVKVFILN